MEELLKRIDAIFQRFADGEIGKSLFAIIALKEMIFNEIRSYKSENIKDEVKK